MSRPNQWPASAPYALTRVPGDTNAQAMDAARAARLAAGLPIVRDESRRSLKWGWVFVCPVPACMLMFDGHETAQQCRGAWLGHCLEEAGKSHPADFTPAWPADVPMELESRAVPAPRPARAPVDAGPPWCVSVVDVPEVTFWDWASASWQESGLLTRADGLAVMVVGAEKAARQIAGIIQSCAHLPPGRVRVYQQEPDGATQLDMFAALAGAPASR